ncbi:MAG: TrmH family RNA methyltransferase [Cyclobacteriaceae bacterium]|jgi:TrmH family RNA methyltransferase
MITNKDVKFIKSLQLKKYRNRENAFVVEGEKNVLELLKSNLEISQLYLTAHFQEKHEDILKMSVTSFESTTEKELVKAGSYQTNQAGLAVVNIPKSPSVNIQNGLFLAFDNVQDPGNLGTIIRIADWYGFKEIICSKDSVDVYNPKTISATMGSFTRISVHYEDLGSLISQSKVPVYGAVLDGESIHETSIEDHGILLFGNESQGISEALKKSITHNIKIPGYGQAESLNVAIATAVVCDNVRRILG